MIHINLLPYREARRQRLLIHIFIIWGVIALMGLAGALILDFHLQTQIEEREAKKVQQEQEIATLKRKLGEVSELNAMKIQVEARLDAINKLRDIRDLNVHVLEELTETLPEDMWILRLSTVKNTLTLSGMAQSNAGIAQFMRNLKASPYFSEPNLSRISQSGSTLKTFSLTTAYKTPSDKPGNGKPPL
jgi:type IV pilus assembly protein PilN